MTTTILKISKKVAEMLADGLNPDGGISKRVTAEVDAGRVQKDGSVMIEATGSDCSLLYGFALGSISKLDTALLTVDPADKHRLMGQHSAWRSLVRQVAIPSSEAMTAAGGTPAP